MHAKALAWGSSPVLWRTSEAILASKTCAMRASSLAAGRSTGALLTLQSGAHAAGIPFGMKRGRGAAAAAGRRDFCPLRMAAMREAAFCAAEVAAASSAALPAMSAASAAFCLTAAASAADSASMAASAASTWCRVGLGLR